VTFKRETLGAHPVIDCMAIAIGEKLPEMLATNWALHFVTHIEGTYQEAEQVAAPD
jgi:hypothetical protein